MQKLLASILRLNAQLEAELNAAKVDDLVASNPRLEAEIRSLNDKDPSKTKKYLPWGVKQLLRGESVDDVASVIKDYNANIAKLEVKDINKYATLSSLKEDLAKLAPSKKETAKQVKGNIKVFLDDDRWLLARPLTVEASCFYGKGTKWCISGRMAERYYNDYSASNTFFYFLIDKKAEGRGQFSKIAISMIKNMEGFIIVWDAKDDILDEEVVEQHLEENGLSYEEIIRICRADCDSQPDTWQYQLMQSRGRETEKLFFEHYPFSSQTILSTLASRSASTPAVLEELAKHDDPMLRMTVANNRATPEHVLKKLSEDEDLKVKRHAIIALLEKEQAAVSARRVKGT